MEELNYLNCLYDYYKDLLTDKQKTYFEDYYFDNLLIDEIAENYNVSKNAVSKSLIEVKEKLLDYENKLHLFSNKNNVKEILDDNTFKKIENYV